MTTNDAFYAKILLFGEYSILCNSMGLSIPYTHFKGELSYINDDKYTDLDFARASNKMLARYWVYLQELAQNGGLMCNFDLAAFGRDLKQTLYFESSIPQGYGVGSSGALVAALYHKYVKGAIPPQAALESCKMQKLKTIFAQLEGFFHGTSSGIDPFNSYLQQPLLIKSQKQIQTVGIPRYQTGDRGGIFLIDTKQTGQTEPLVNWFMEKCRHKAFLNRVQQTFIPLTNRSIEALLKGDTETFFFALRALSDFVLKQLGPMIPDAFKPIWQQGLDTQDFFLKLCGSGGGGFLLGFAPDLEKARKLLIIDQIEIIPVYRILSPNDL